ncbi:hydrolase 76 protein, partial [Tulasnella sp. 332]
MWKIAYHLQARGKDALGYLKSTSELYGLVAAPWDTTNCGGRVWWSTAKTYKNVITNDLVLYTSADGYLRTGQASHLENAQKGILMEHLLCYLDMANDPARKAKYAPIIAAQAPGVFHYGKNATKDIGSVWYAPNAGGSVWQPEGSARGLAAIVAAAK